MLGRLDMPIRAHGLRTGWLAAVALAVVTGVESTAAQPRQRAADGQPLPSIADETAGMQRIDGFFPMYWDAKLGELWMEIARFDTEVLHVAGLGAGLGSNDIGLDRGRLMGSRVVEFERVGRKVLMVQPNYEFRASSSNAAELATVRDAFARSVLWGFTVEAESDGAVLVALNDFLIRDATNIGQRLRPGTYRLDAGRSTIYMPMTAGFPQNTEMEAELTFVRQAGGGGGGFGGFGFNAGGWFEGVSNVSASGDAASLRVHHSFVQLPDPGFEPRVFDPRAGYGAHTFEDYSAPLGQSMTKRFIRRHRLKKVNPSAAVSEVVEPIVYYLDPGTPEPVRSALLDGARWWAQAFEAAGFRNAFRVELLPEGVSPLDIRYNVINWVHRSTRGWSSGATVTDPRTGEIMKAVVTLGSLRIRQDYMIAEGLLSPYENGNETPTGIAEWALARIRQLSAHEVGHTLGLGHNYYDSRAGRISVMDYPHPLVTLGGDGSFDYSEVYDVDIGEWDAVAINYGYREFTAGVDEAAELRRILDDAWDRDVRYLTNQDISTHPRADQWSNGTDAAAELLRMLDVRAVALRRFGERAIQLDVPVATLEEVLVPLYLHHRYQIEAAASVLGGVDYVYAMRGDGRKPLTPASATDQREALDALLRTIAPSVVALPSNVLALLPPRPPGYRPHRELFPRYTGSAFDAITPAVVASSHTVGAVLNAQRAARLVQQHALDPSLPGLDDVIDGLFAASFEAAPQNEYEAELNRAVERVVIDELGSLAVTAQMPQVRAIATLRLERKMEELAGMAGETNGGDAAHYHLLARDIHRMLERPGPALEAPGDLVAPPGAPIGDLPMDWLGVLGPICTWTEW